MSDDTATDATGEGPARPRISDETADRLHDRMQRNESFNDVIERLLDMADEMEADE